MRRRSIAAVCLLLLASCGGNTPAPAPAPEQPALSAPAPAATNPEAAAAGTVRVNVSTLNVRDDASVTAAIVGHVRRGERLTLIAESAEWLHVRLHDGTTGWVSAQLVVRDGESMHPRRAGCPSDSAYSFVNAPKPSFAELGPHGMVVVEATVDARGIVTSTRVVSNDTHDASLAALAEREIRGARFAPPIRNCVPRPFFFTYKRAF